MSNKHVHKATYRHSRNLLESTQVYFREATADAAGVHLVRISREKWRPSFGVRSRTPVGVMVQVVMGGAGTMTIDKESHALAPGDVFVLHPGRVFDVRGETWRRTCCARRASR